MSRGQVNGVSYVVTEISSVDALFFYILDSPRPKSVFRCHCLPSAFSRLSLGEVPMRFQSGSNEVPIKLGGIQGAIHWGNASCRLV